MQEITGGFMKPPQHTCTEGCPMLPNAACVTGIAWRTGCHGRSGCVTTQRSAVVTRPHSELKYEWRGNIFKTCSNASGITTWLLNKYFSFSNDNVERPVYTGRTFWFYPRPLRQSGKQGTVGL
jgi:hypothetical protein